MKKYIITILLFNLFFFFIPINVFASYDAIITGDSVNIRAGAGKDNTALYTVNSNTKIEVVDKTLYEGSGCSSKWYKILYKEKTGYVCSKYVKFVDYTFDGIYIKDWDARVNANNVAVRKSADVSSTKLATLSLGANVEILSEENGKTASCSEGKWYKIKYDGNNIGYMCKSYVTKKSDITTTDETYAATLKEKGFDESYIPYLTYLHNKYPNWEFKAKKIEDSFAVAVSSEEGKNYMQTTNDNYRTSSTPAEGSTWFKANSAVIAFYMDPRNWLSEKRIFMFEKLDYTTELKEDYPTLVKTIFGSGKLSSDTYTSPMIKAGETYSVSPLAIATRIRLEVGANGSDSCNGTEFTWKGTTYSGFYNFFNIGAYEDTIDGIEVNSVKRGLLYAAKLIDRDGEKWDNIETSILEGSKLLANGYINKGQGTLYYQKFNVSPDAYFNNYTHQYMTNIQAPATEGNQTYNSYSDGEILSEKIIFEIPVYKNMPSYTSLPISGDTNNNLASLEVEGYNITPEFDSDILTYQVYVPKSLEKVNIKANAASSVATISGIGEIELKTDETDITIVVTSETNETKSYTISILKVDDTTTVNDVISKSSYTTKDNYITKLKNNTSVNTILSNLTKNGAQNAIIKDTKNNQVNGNTIVGTGYTLTITTAIETKTYTIVVNGDTSGDGKVTILDLLQVQKHIKKITTIKDANLLAADTSGDNKVTILDLLQIQKHIKKIKSL